MTLEQENLIKSLVYEKTGDIPLKIKISNLVKNLGLLNTKYRYSEFTYDKIKILCEMYVLCLKSLSTNLETLRKEIFIKNDKDYLVTRAHLMFDIRNCIDLQSQTPSDKYRLDVSLYNLMKNVEHNATNLGYKFFEYLKLMIEEMR